MKKVSVIVPVYNVEQYLRKCLDSLVNQTLKDIEIIVVNDGTKDNSQDIIDEYVKKYPKKVFSYIKENGGLSSARNYGVKKAHGKYIGFVDSDDYVDLDLYEKMYDTAIKENADVVGCPVKKVYKKHMEPMKFNADLFNKSVMECPKLLLDIRSYAPNKLYRKEIWDKFEFPIQYFEDSAVVYNVLLDANKVSAVFDSYYYYNRANETAITRVLDRRSYDIFKSCDSILEFYNERGCYSKLKDTVDKICIKHIRFRIRSYISNNDMKGLKEYVLYSNEYLDKKIPGWKKNSINKLDKTDKKKNNLYKNLFINKLVLNVYVFFHDIKCSIIKK